MCHKTVTHHALCTHPPTESIHYDNCPDSAYYQSHWGDAQLTEQAQHIRLPYACEPCAQEFFYMQNDANADAMRRVHMRRGGREPPQIVGHDFQSERDGIVPMTRWRREERLRYGYPEEYARAYLEGSDSDDDDDDDY